MNQTRKTLSLVFATVINFGLTTSLQAQDKPPKAPTAHEFCQSLGTGKYSGIQGIPDVLSMRGCAWLQAGLITSATEPDLMQAAKAGNGQPGSPPWVAAFTTVGDKYMAIGEKAEAENNDTGAHRGFESAAQFYYLARWPHIFSPEAGAAYQKNVIAYRKAGSYDELPIQEINIPHADKILLLTYGSQNRKNPCR